jgi:muramoyltetrapeptide carboxypeptidase LdcA involved in peptidoglycan recycling
MNLKKFQTEIIKKARNRDDVVLERHKLKYSRKSFNLLKIRSKNIGPKDKVVLITAGIHGDEVAGPTSIQKYLHEIFDYAHNRDLKLIVYPLMNPSGFYANTRYNIDGEQVNNDFIRYETPDGQMVDDLGADGKYAKWFWSSDKRLELQLPVETEMMHSLLKKDPLRQVVAAVDLHQDYITSGMKPCTYHYGLGDLSAYAKIIENLNRLVPVLPDFPISAGQNGDPIKTDANGFIVRHDGTIYDLLYRLGVKYSVTVESSGATPMLRARRVNLVWIKGLIDLVAPKKETVALAAQASLLPKKISAQSKVHLVHTSSPVMKIYQNSFSKALAKLQKNYPKVKLFDVLKNDLDPRHLAASEKERLTKFRRAAKKVDWLQPVFGGTGAIDIARHFDDNDLKRIKKSRPVINGFSDTVVLINYFYFKLKLLSFHYSNFVGTMDNDNSQIFFDIIEGRKDDLLYQEKDYRYLGEKPAKPVEGVAIGGNLSTFRDLLDVCRIKVKSWKPYVLFLEDVELDVEDLHRQVIALDDKGVFRNIRALVLGNFDEASVARDYQRFNFMFGRREKQDDPIHIFNYLLEEVIRERREDNDPLYIMKVSNLGHGVKNNNMIIPIGAKTVLHPGGKIEFQGPFVS